MKRVFVFVLLIALIFLTNGCTEATLGPTSAKPQPAMYKQLWKSAEPVAIADYSYSGSTLNLSVMNTSAYTITINSFEIRVFDYVSTTTSDIKLTPGQKKYISITIGSPCSSGSRFNISKDQISIVYSAPGKSKVLQSKIFDLVGKCQ